MDKTFDKRKTKSPIYNPGDNILELDNILGKFPSSTSNTKEHKLRENSFGKVA